MGHCLLKGQRHISPAPRSAQYRRHRPACPRSRVAGEPARPDNPYPCATGACQTWAPAVVHPSAPADSLPSTEAFYREYNLKGLDLLNLTREIEKQRISKDDIDSLKSIKLLVYPEITLRGSTNIQNTN